MSHMSHKYYGKEYVILNFLKVELEKICYKIEWSFFVLYIFFACNMIN